ncbi:hypothetical protein PV328_011931, partial [Microctonus aethiopoides]
MSQSENMNKENPKDVVNPRQLEADVLKENLKNKYNQLRQMVAYVKQIHGIDPLDERTIEFLSQPNPSTSENESSPSTSRQQPAPSSALNHQQQILNSKPQGLNSICAPQSSASTASNPPLPPSASTA